MNKIATLAVVLAFTFGAVACGEKTESKTPDAGKTGADAGKTGADAGKTGADAGKTGADAGKTGE